MKLLENESKRIFREYGISTPAEVACGSREEIFAALRGAKERMVIKPMGIKKRGKAGLIEFADSGEDAIKKLDALDSKMHGHENVGFIVEERVDIRKEFYVAVTIDYAVGEPVLLVSSEGGMDIEEVAKEDKKGFSSMPISLIDGLDREGVLDTLRNAGIEDADAFYGIVEKAYKIFLDYDAETLEINPVALDSRGGLVAVDAVLNIDDASLYRHAELETLNNERRYKNEFEREMAAQGWAYLELEGNIGIISSGAGLSMSTLDLIKIYGGEPANFLDMAQVDGNGIKKGLEILSRKKGMKVIFINLVAGLNRCDSMAEGVKAFMAENTLDVPVVVRMVGNRSEEGARVLREAGLENIESLEDAITKAIAESKK